MRLDSVQLSQQFTPFWFCDQVFGIVEENPIVASLYLPVKSHIEKPAEAGALSACLKPNI